MKKINLSAMTKSNILDAASRLIMLHGVEAFTLDAVAREADISKGGLLYHFPTKDLLIQGMIERMIADVDAALAEELEKTPGDYVSAYIRASFRTQSAQGKLSYALFAAIASNPALTEPLRLRFQRMQREISAAASSEELGTLIRLALDGLWFSDLFQFAPPTAGLREKLQASMLVIAGGAAGKNRI
jgi:AcrR family transcriptional regulator